MPIVAGPHNARMSTAPAPLAWDLFCRVIDNHGDLGVCWRLARALAALGDRVELVVDDASALAWMAPQGAPGVTLRRWDDPPHRPGDVVVEAFGCDPPTDFVQRMANAVRPPVWINLEYLSAEAYVERSHGLPSPQRNGLSKWFFYPGFNARTGGLIRDLELPDDATQAAARGWLVDRGWLASAEHTAVSLFCYDNPALAGLLAWLEVMAHERPTTLLATPGFAQRQVATLRDAGWTEPPGLTVVDLPWLKQIEFDRLLASCQLNLVRGEDSLVRAIWAGRPFVWQLYPQRDQAHHAKLEAFLAAADLPDDVRAIQRHWNGLTAVPASPSWPDLAPWAQSALLWRQRLAEGPELTGRLRDFVLARRKPRESP
jgi:uncharacterized repeat protein (TIGR03837 family)